MHVGSSDFAGAVADGIMRVMLYSLVVGIIIPLALTGFAIYFYAMYKANKKKKPNLYVASSLCGIAAIVAAFAYWAWLLG